MPKETPELPVSPRAAGIASGDTRQEVQIQAPSLLDKIKIHKLKILGGILGAVIFIGAVFGAYKLGQKSIYPEPVEGPTPTPEAIATPTPDPTADWKIYTNTEYGYSIKYPGEWFVSEKHQPVEEVIFSITKELKAPTPLSISVRIDENPNNLTLKQWVDGIFENYPPSLASQIRRESTSFGGNGAERIYIPGEGASWSVITLHNGRFYSLNIGTIDVDGKGEEDMNLDTFDLMLSTFKFISEEAVGEKVYCEDPRPEVCTMECIVNPPYICGSDGKSYCNVCGACADPEVEWYIIQDTPCKP